MLGDDRINVSEGINTEKTDGLHEHILCHYWYFLRINFRFQPKVYDKLPGYDTKLYDFALVTVRRKGILVDEQKQGCG